MTSNVKSTEYTWCTKSNSFTIFQFNYKCLFDLLQHQIPQYALFWCTLFYQMYLWFEFYSEFLENTRFRLQILKYKQTFSKGMIKLSFFVVHNVEPFILPPKYWITFYRTLPHSHKMHSKLFCNSHDSMGIV